MRRPSLVCPTSTALQVQGTRLIAGQSIPGGAIGQLKTLSTGVRDALTELKRIIETHSVDLNDECCAIENARRNAAVDGVASSISRQPETVVAYTAITDEEKRKRSTKLTK